MAWSCSKTRAPPEHRWGVREGGELARSAVSHSCLGEEPPSTIVGKEEGERQGGERKEEGGKAEGEGGRQGEGDRQTDRQKGERRETGATRGAAAGSLLPCSQAGPGFLSPTWKARPPPAGCTWDPRSVRRSLLQTASAGSRP